MTNHGSVARVKALGSDGSDQLSVNSDGASGAPPPVDVKALGSDGGIVPSVKPDGAVEEGGGTLARSGASGSDYSRSTCAAADNATVSSLGAAAVGVLPAGRHVRRDHGDLRDHGGRRSDDGPPREKRRRTDAVHTRAQLLRCLGGSAAPAPRGGDDTCEMEQRSPRRGGSASTSEPSANDSHVRLQAQPCGATSSVVTSRQQLLARLRAVGGSSSVASTALHASGARSQEAVSGAFSTHAVNNRLLPDHLRIANGPSMCTNSSSARAYRADPGGAPPPALPAVPRHAARPRYPSSDPRATRPG